MRARGQRAFWRKGASWAGKDRRLALLTPGADRPPCPTLPLGTSGSGAKTGEDTISALRPKCAVRRPLPQTLQRPLTRDRRTITAPT